MKTAQEKTTVLVTGAGSGIGRGIAIRLAKDGYRIAAADIQFESEEASFITGNVLVVDGGMTVKSL